MISSKIKKKSDKFFRIILISDEARNDGSMDTNISFVTEKEQLEWNGVKRVSKLYDSHLS